MQTQTPPAPKLPSWVVELSTLMVHAGVAVHQATDGDVDLPSSHAMVMSVLRRLRALHHAPGCPHTREHVGEAAGLLRQEAAGLCKRLRAAGSAANRDSHRMVQAVARFMMLGRWALLEALRRTAN